MRSRGWKWCVPMELLVLSLLLLAVDTQDHVASIVNAVSGSNVSLQIPERLPDNYKKLSWLYTIHQAIVEWTPTHPPNHFNDPKFKGRFVLDPQTGALNISNLQKDDSSTYLIRLYSTERLEKTWKILLQVFDPVRKPVIKIETVRQENNCYMKLSCAIPDQSPDQCENCTCTWHEDSGPLPNECLSSALELEVPVPQNYSKFYTCRVSNPVSSENDTVYFTPPCTLSRSSGINWIASWLIVMVPTILGLLLT